MDGIERRPLASRDTAWARGIQRRLLDSQITANQVSFIGIVFAALGGWVLAGSPGHSWLLLVGAVLIQLRLLANLMDGLVAVEGGRGSPTGPLWNEAPDRLEDALILSGFGYAAGLPILGFVAAMLAIFTAYVRVLGATHGLAQDFRGPMAKPQRMATLTVACVLGFVEGLVFGTAVVLQLALWIVVIGTAGTAWRRLARIAEALKARQP